ncbi:MAG: DUF4815 domain-containing protein [Chloroflexota bacterium]|nr:DUF4815 domain-containing protein [Chloroflexota bacterium]
MKTDISRFTFRPDRHYSAVLQQQGRVSLDADFNEHTEIDRHRSRTLARDLIGACGGPRDAAGFGITVGPGGELMIGAGRYYVDGLLVENEHDCAIDDQPDIPSGGAALTVPASTRGGQIVYLDVWEREITALDDPLLREVALGGPDTTTRLKVVWQARFRPLVGDSDVGCDDRATLNVRIRKGYAGLENRLYRVEIHTADAGDDVTFKWSRDNASLVLPLASIDADQLTLTDSAADSADRLAPGDWLELLDDALELDREGGLLAQIVALDRRRVSIAPVDHDLAVDLSLHPKARRWAGVGAITSGVKGHGWMPLEDGIEVAFGGGNPQPGEYWLIPARPANASVEWPNGPQPAQRIEHYTCPLAVVESGAGTSTWLVVEDRRRLFAPLAG